ncbi:hypothetical protein ACOME3_007906 [Neoechinorhynchus agilis]
MRAPLTSSFHREMVSPPASESLTMLQQIAFRLYKCLKQFTFFPIATKGVDNSSLSNGELQPSQSNFIIGRRNSKYMLALSVLCQKEDTNSHSYNSREAEQPQQLLSNLLMGSKHFIRPLANMNRSSDLSDKCNAPHYENIANSDDNQDSEEGTLKDAYEARCRVLNSGEWKNYNVRNYVRQVKKSIEIPIIRHIEIEVCNKNLENEGKEKNNLNTESTNPIGNIQSSIKDRHSQIDNRPHVWQATSIDCSSLAGTLDDVSSVLDQSPYESLESGKGEELNENSTKKLRQTRSLTSIDELANKKRTQVRKKSKSKNRPKKDAPVHRQIEQHTNDSDPDWCFDLIGPSSESETSTTSSPFDNALTAVDDVFVKGKKCIERSSKSDRVRLLSSMEPKIETTKKAVVDSAIISAKVSIESQATVKSNKTLTSKSSPSSSLKDTKPCFVTLPSNVTVNAGETARFVCYAVGDPHPTVRWFLNTVLLKEDGRVRIGNTGFDHFLEIDDVVADESGKVKCMLDNSSGSREAQVDLYVKSESYFPI